MLVSITVSIESVEEIETTLAILNKLLPGSIGTTTASVAPATEEAAAATEPEPTQTPEKPSAPVYTLEVVRAKLAELSRSGKQAEVKQLIESFGAKKLTDIPADVYDAVMAAAEAIQ